MKKSHTDIAADFMKLWKKIGKEMEYDQQIWIAKLRKAGVKAAHPDDGWVNREENEVHFSYPQFNDGVEVGDKIALGWPGDKTRIVTVTGIIERGPLGPLVYYQFA